MRRGRSGLGLGTGAQWSRVRIRDGGTTRQGCNGLGTGAQWVRVRVRDGGTTRRVRKGTGEQWDGGIQGRHREGYCTNGDSNPQSLHPELSA